jgi:hypothetical protein
MSQFQATHLPHEAAVEPKRRVCCLAEPWSVTVRLDRVVEKRSNLCKTVPSNVVNLQYDHEGHLTDLKQGRIWRTDSVVLGSSVEMRK